MISALAFTQDENMIFDMEKAILAAADARRPPAPHQQACLDGIHVRLADGVEAMRRCGPAARHRLAELVVTSSLSKQSFARHFPTAEALVGALLADGVERLAGSIARRMATEATPEARIRSWVEGVMAVTDEDVAATALAVLGRVGSLGDELAAARHVAGAPLATLLRAPFAALGCRDPDLGASLAAHAALGRVCDHLSCRSRPTPAELDDVTWFLITAARAPSAASPATSRM